MILREPLLADQHPQGPRMGLASTGGHRSSGKIRGETGTRRRRVSGIRARPLNSYDTCHRMKVWIMTCVIVKTRFSLQADGSFDDARRKRSGSGASAARAD